MEIDLAGWLQQLKNRSARERNAQLIIGASGHLLLTEKEAAHAAAHLRSRVLPDLIRDEAPEEVILVTGAAPGADQIFMRTAQTWLDEVRVPWRSVALLPVPVEQLYEDWLARTVRSGVQPSAAARKDGLEALRSVIASADLRVHLFAAEGHEATEDGRNLQYRQLAACLAQQSDVLIAILRAQNVGAPGGTAEVVDWRCHPSRIPRELSTWSSQHSRAFTERMPLVLIDPSIPFEGEPRNPVPVEAAPSDDESAVLARAEAALHAGNDLLCNDIVYRAIRRGLNSRRLQYLRILSLASGGSTELASSQYRELQLQPEELSEGWLALEGRLEKDLALRGTAHAQRHFQNAAQAYLDAYRRWRGSYTGTNAATMWLMAGDTVQSRSLAAEVLQQLASEAPDTAGESDTYFRHVTEAELALLIGDTEGCRQHLVEANLLLKDDAARRSRTIRQLQLICRALSVDPELLSALRLPPVVLIARSEPWWVTAGQPPTHSIAPLPDAVRNGALVFFGLSDLLDLKLAEALLECGARIYPTLPCPSRLLKRLCAQRWGSSAAMRLERVLNQAERISTIRGFLEAELEWCAQHLHTVSSGLSLLHAQRLSNTWRLLHLRCEPGKLECVTHVEIDNVGEHLPEALAHSRLPPGCEVLPNPPRRRMVGLIFADFAGFHRISDEQLPQYWSEIMQSVAVILDTYGDRVLGRNTWGDALHVVTSDASSATEIATAIQQHIEQHRDQRGGHLSSLELRMAVHYAAAFDGYDPVRKVRNFYGSQFLFTARIEPVTPPGLVFGSEALVAQLALESPGRFSINYAGEIELAKRFGKYRLFAIRPQDED